MRAIRVCVVLLVVVFVTACGTSKSSKFYVLNSLADLHEAPVKTKSKHVGIGIGPIKFPRALQQPQILTRKGSHEVDRAEFNRWAEPLDENFSRVLIEDLSMLIPSNYIYSYPWKSHENVVYQVAITVNRFDMNPDGSTLLRLKWALVDNEDREVIKATTNSYVNQAREPEEYDSTVAAMNRNLADFSRDLAKSLKNLRNKPRDTES